MGTPKLPVTGSVGPRGIDQQQALIFVGALESQFAVEGLDNSRGKRQDVFHFSCGVGIEMISAFVTVAGGGAAVSVAIEVAVSFTSTFSATTSSSRVKS